MNATQNDDKVISNALAEALNALGKDTGGAIAALKRRSTQTRRMLRWVIALSVLSAVTIGVMIATVVNTRGVAEEVSDIQHRTSDEVLCPLYNLFLEASKFPPPPNYSAEQLKTREGWFVQIGEGHTVLGCKSR